MPSDELMWSSLPLALMNHAWWEKVQFKSIFITKIYEPSLLNLNHTQSSWLSLSKVDWIRIMFNNLYLWWHYDVISRENTHSFKFACSLCHTAGNPWAAPEGWNTMHPQLNLNLDDQVPYVLHGGSLHAETEVIHYVYCWPGIFFNISVVNFL